MGGHCAISYSPPHHSPPLNPQTLPPSSLTHCLCPRTSRANCRNYKKVMLTTAYIRLPVCPGHLGLPSSPHVRALASGWSVYKFAILFTPGGDESFFFPRTGSEGFRGGECKRFMFSLSHVLFIICTLNDGAVCFSNYVPCYAMRSSLPLTPLSSTFAKLYTFFFILFQSEIKVLIHSKLLVPVHFQKLIALYFSEWPLLSVSGKKEARNESTKK